MHDLADMPTVTVRAARVDDVPDLVRMHRILLADHALMCPEDFRTGQDPTDVAKFFNLIVQTNPELLMIAEQGRSAVGYALIDLIARPASVLCDAARILYLHQIIVDPTWQRNGVGAALIGCVITAATVLQATTIMLDSVWSNHGSHHFFREQGFHSSSVIFRREIRELK
jgi:ribosomal protein S18 acetylase RimI-like enzyme